MMKVAFVAFAGLFGLATAQTCENVEEYSLDLLYDVIRIQRDTQLSILADVQSLCASTGTSCSASVDGLVLPGGGGAAPGTVGGGMSLTVSPDYAASLTDSVPGALDDCYITPGEAAADPDAAAMFEAFRSAVAENMGVDPSMVQLTGVHTDGDSEIGCGGGTSVGGGFSLNVDDTYINSLGTSDALSDCLIDASEMASDPEAAAMAQAIIEAQAAALGVDPSTISITGVHTDGDPAPGCQGTGRRVLTFEGSHS